MEEQRQNCNYLKIQDCVAELAKINDYESVVEKGSRLDLVHRS